MGCRQRHHQQRAPKPLHGRAPPRAPLPSSSRCAGPPHMSLETHQGPEQRQLQNRRSWRQEPILQPGSAAAARLGDHHPRLRSHSPEVLTVGLGDCALTHSPHRHPPPAFSSCRPHGGPTRCRAQDAKGRILHGGGQRAAGVWEGPAGGVGVLSCCWGPALGADLLWPLEELWGSPGVAVMRMRCQGWSSGHCPCQRALCHPHPLAPPFPAGSLLLPLLIFILRF